MTIKDGSSDCYNVNDTHELITVLVHYSKTCATYVGFAIAQAKPECTNQ